MAQSRGLSLAWCGWLVCLVGSLAVAQETETDRIPELLRQLDADTFDARQKASAALAEIGEPALAALAEAAANRDATAEVRRRAGDLVKQIKLQQIKRQGVKLADALAQAELAKQGKLDPAQLDAILDRWTFIVSEVAGTPRLAIPKAVGLPTVAPGDNISARNALVVGDNVKLVSASGCIILARISVQVSSVSNCVIIAGVACDTSSPRNSLLLVGDECQLSIAQDCIALCGRELQASIPRRSQLGAGGLCRLSIAEDCVLFNTPLPANGLLAPGGRAPSRSVETPAIDLKLPEREQPLKGVLRVTEIVASRSNGLALFRRREGDGEYVARIGKPLVFPDNRPMPELEGWQLQFCGRQYAVFVKGDQQTLVRVEPGP